MTKVEQSPASTRRALAGLRSLYEECEEFVFQNVRSVSETAFVERTGLSKGTLNKLRSGGRVRPETMLRAAAGLAGADWSGLAGKPSRQKRK